MKTYDLAIDVEVQLPKGALRRRLEAAGFDMSKPISRKVDYNSCVITFTQEETESENSQKG